MVLQCVILETLYWHVRELTAKLLNACKCTLNNKDTKAMTMTSTDMALVALMSTLNIFVLVPTFYAGLQRRLLSKF